MRTLLLDEPLTAASVVGLVLVGDWVLARRRTAPARSDAATLGSTFASPS